MPLDTSTYALALLRTDGRRWNELRRLRARLRVHAAADGSAYLEMGGTKVLCVVTGPGEAPQRTAGGRTGGGASAVTGSGEEQRQGTIEVSVVVAGFSTVDRKRRGRGDKRVLEMQSTVSRALASTMHTHLFPHSTLSVQLTVLSADGSLLAALLNAAGLACVDAGVPMTDYLCACTAGSTSAFAAADEAGTNSNPGGADPLLDLNLQEETELPGLTAATLGSRGDKVVVLVCESRVRAERLEGMLAVAVDGCKQIRALLDAVVRETAGAAPDGRVDFVLDEGGMDVDM